MKQRIIFHIDVNSAYLSWTAVKMLREQPDSTDLRTIPAVIGGDQSKRHGVVLAKSLPARKYGIKTGEPIVQAVRKCPDLVMHKPDFDWYVKCSHAFMDILGDFSPIIEQASIDEAYLDMTGMEQLLGPPLEVAHQLKDRVYNELGFTVNVGISTNKLLAKMASDFEKPGRVHTLFPEEMAQKFWPLPIRDLFSVGGSTEKQLLAMDIRTIGDLAHADPVMIRTKLKKHGEMIHNYANGIDPAPVESEPEQAKYYGSSTTTAADVTTTSEAHIILLSLSETVGARLRHDHLKASCVAVSITDNSFKSSSKQTMLHASTDITKEIYEHACRLFDQLWDHKKTLRLLGVHTSKITDEAIRQYSLFDTEDYEKRQKLDAAIDSIRAKYGDNAVQRARFLDSDISHLAGGMGPAKLENNKDVLKDIAGHYEDSESV